MRIAKTTNRDKSIPVNIESLITDKDDCFGNEWELSHKSCLSCSEYETCMVLYLENNNTNLAAIKKDHKHFFDELDWKAIPWDDIYEEILLSPGEISIEDFRSTVKTLSKCIDDETVNMKIQNWLIENEIKITKGCLYSY